MSSTESNLQQAFNQVSLRKLEVFLLGMSRTLLHAMLTMQVMLVLVSKPVRNPYFQVMLI